MFSALTQYNEKFKEMRIISCVLQAKINRTNSKKKIEHSFTAQQET